jgi:hypothetical protein
VTNNPQLLFRYINTRLWSKAGHFNKALSKGPKTTTWVWNLHDNGHDFDIQQSSIAVITRKVFSSNLAHLSLVFFWISGMYFHMHNMYYTTLSEYKKFKSLSIHHLMVVFGASL